MEARPLDLLLTSAGLGREYGSWRVRRVRPRGDASEAALLASRERGVVQPAWRGLAGQAQRPPSWPGAIQFAVTKFLATGSQVP
jgi:hypothetical protein